MNTIHFLKIRPIIFLIRYPKNDDFKDGYFQRVFAIDEIFDRIKITRLYVSVPDNFSFFPNIRLIKNNVYEIGIDNRNFIHLLVLFCMGFFSKGVYLHSIMRIKTPMHFMTFFCARKRILDVHGSVPEEMEMDAGITKKTILLHKLEKIVTKSSNILIVVTNAMMLHLKEKHGLKNKTFILLPIFSQKRDNIIKKKYSNKIIYCGGLQEWQNVEEMLRYVNNFQDEYQFTFLVPDPEKLKKKYFEIYQKEFPGKILTVSSDKVHKWYAQHSFGFVLRDDIIVNNVACPTKLIEYLQYQVVPIIKSRKIGDFDKLGYNFVDYRNSLPNEEQFLLMIEKNNEILKELEKISENGSRTLLNCII